VVAEAPWYWGRACGRGAAAELFKLASVAAEPDTDAGPSTARALEPERVAELLDGGGVALIDVREPHEWEAGRLSGARHIPIERVSSEAVTIDRDRTVVFYCRGGNRSEMVADAFSEDGYDAYNMAGGISAWAERGLPLEPEDGHVAGR
jgi:rhodanese-related sulfurtransferase